MQIVKSLEEARDDNQRFALLLILGQMIKSKGLDKEELKNDPVLNKRLFNSIGAHFLARLVTTKQSGSSETLSEAATPSPLMYKCVSMSILTQFLEYPELIADPVLLTKLDMIVESLVDTDLSKHAEYQQFKYDTFKYLYALSSHCPDYLVLNVDLISKLLKNIVLNPKCHDETVDDLSDETSEINKNDSSTISIACKLIVEICNQVAKQDQPGKSDSYRVMKWTKIDAGFMEFVRQTHQTQSEFKFKLVYYLNYFLGQEILKEYVFSGKEQINDCLFNMLNDLFRSKLKADHKELAFVLLSRFVSIYQFEYIYMKNRNFFYLLIHLVCIQIGLGLEMASTENSSSLLLKQANKICIYYSLLEEIIVILSTASPFDEDQDSEDEDDYKDSDTDEDADDDIDFIKKSQDTKKPPSSKENDDDQGEPELNHAIKVIVECLQTVTCFLNDFIDEANLSEIKDQVRISLLVSSIRLVACWLSHESLMEEEIVELISRKLIPFCSHIKENLKYSDELNGLQFISSGLNRVLASQEDKLRSKSGSSRAQDETRREFEKTEIKESVDSLKAMLAKCKLR